MVSYNWCDPTHETALAIVPETRLVVSSWVESHGTPAVESAIPVYQNIDEICCWCVLHALEDLVLIAFSTVDCNCERCEVLVIWINHT